MLNQLDDGSYKNPYLHFNTKTIFVVRASLASYIRTQSPQWNKKNEKEPVSVRFVKHLFSKKASRKIISTK